jgi:hypothetical protein
MSSCDELDATEINGAETFDPGNGADATATVDTADAMMTLVSFMNEDKSLRLGVVLVLR